MRVWTWITILLLLVAVWGLTCFHHATPARAAYVPAVNPFSLGIGK